MAPCHRLSVWISRTASFIIDPPNSRHALCLRMSGSFGASLMAKIDLSIPKQSQLGGYRFRVGSLRPRTKKHSVCWHQRYVFLWKVSVLLLNENVPVDFFFSQVTMPTSVDPEEHFRDRFPCPILDFADRTCARFQCWMPFLNLLRANFALWWKCGESLVSAHILSHTSMWFDGTRGKVRFLFLSDFHTMCNNQVTKDSEALDRFRDFRNYYWGRKQDD